MRLTEVSAWCHRLTNKMKRERVSISIFCNVQRVTKFQKWMHSNRRLKKHPKRSKMNPSPSGLSWMRIWLRRPRISRTGTWMKQMRMTGMKRSIYDLFETNTLFHHCCDRREGLCFGYHECLLCISNISFQESLLISPNQCILCIWGCWGDCKAHHRRCEGPSDSTQCGCIWRGSGRRQTLQSHVSKTYVVHGVSARVQSAMNETDGWNGRKHTDWWGPFHNRSAPARTDADPRLEWLASAWHTILKSIPRLYHLEVIRVQELLRRKNTEHHIHGDQEEQNHSTHHPLHFLRLKIVGGLRVTIG